MKEMLLLKVKQCIQYKIAVLTYNCINKTAPKYLQDLLMMQAARPNSEANAKLSILHPNTSQVRDSSFTMQVPHIWNALPGEIRKAATLDLFKKQLKCIYSEKHIHRVLQTMLSTLEMPRGELNRR